MGVQHEVAVLLHPEGRVGYRHIDTAAAYYNEKQVGEALANSKVDRSGIRRTKIWFSDFGYDQTPHGFDKSAAKLGLDQIDLLILHARSAPPDPATRNGERVGRVAGSSVSG